jgi:hypothetical protein
MRAALYARYSTEKQSGASIEDQHRLCERLAERHRLTVVDRFSDAAISGGTAERPGYQALLAAARRHELDVIMAEDTSRLWRNLAEQAPRLAELADLGMHVSSWIRLWSRRDSVVLERWSRRARRKRFPTRAGRTRSLKEEIANLTDAIAQGVLRSSPAISEKLGAAEEQLARLEAQPVRQIADVERLILRLSEEIRSAIEALPKALAAGNVDLAREELRGHLGSVRAVAEPERMFLYSVRNLAEAVIARVAGGNMASINGRGGALR